MAERLKADLISDETTRVDLVVGPDAYRSLPKVLAAHINDRERGSGCIRTQETKLSFTETYEDIAPALTGGVSEYVSVMRGCNNMCSYCVVPFTRGRERSRNLQSIVEEVKRAVEHGVKEVTLLGQNVNSYHDKSKEAADANPQGSYQTSLEGFRNMYGLRGGAGHYFSDLVEAVSDVDPELRVRFTSPHPKDFPPPLLQLMASRPNVCSQLHVPAQSGNSQVLERMRRGYTRESYLELIESARSLIPSVSLSSDFITGFCGELEEEHADTLSLMSEVKFDHAFMFAYSMRGKTHAHRKMSDDVPEDVKAKRLQEIIDLFRTTVQEKNENEEMGAKRLVLVEGESKRSTESNVQLTGRTDGNKRVTFPSVEGSNIVAGDYVVAQIDEVRGHTLGGKLVGRSCIVDWANGKRMEAF